ncbi:hypothetical protein ABEF79_01200 [Acinetobacter sp. ANC 7454]|uniref:hypothetical protein n=1 Tax=Acinetobacter thermotolerans TaxID=3151487 RepID=UPI00325B9BE2
MKKYLAFTTLSLSLVGCASTPKAPKSDYFAQVKKEFKTQPVAVLTDACLLRKEVGNNHILLEPSNRIATAITQELIQQLNRNQIKVTQNFQQLHCGFFEKKVIQTYKKRQNLDAKPEDLAVYPVFATNQPQLTDLQGVSLQLLHQKTFKVGIGRYNFSNNYQPVNIEITDAQLEQLKPLLGTSKVLVMQVLGQQPSLGNRIGNIAGSLALAAVTMGTVTTGDPIPQEGQYYLLSYVDLDKKQVLWSKQQKFDGKLYQTEPVSLNTPDMLKPLGL